MARKSKQVAVQMEILRLDGTVTISIISFPEHFRYACDANGINEGTTLWLFQDFMYGPAGRLLDNQLGHTSSRLKSKLTRYPEVINFLLGRYASDEVIAEHASELSALKQVSSPIKFAEAVQAKSFLCGQVYSDHTLIMLFTDGFPEIIQGKVRRYWSDHPEEYLASLAQYEKSLPNPIYRTVEYRSERPSSRSPPRSPKTHN